MPLSFSRLSRRREHREYELSPLRNAHTADSGEEHQVRAGLKLDLKAAKFRRIDLQLLYSFLVCLSTGFSAASFALGLRIVLHRQSLPDFVTNVRIIRNFFPRVTTDLTAYEVHHYIFACSESVYYVVLVAFTTVVTAFLDAHIRIRSTAYLWWRNLEDDNEPEYNSNHPYLSSTEAYGESLSWLS